MMLTFGSIVFMSSIVLLYTQELLRLIRKLTAIPGVSLLVPLVFASWLIEANEDWGLWLLLYAQATFHNFILYTAERLPFQTGSLHLVRIVFLCLLACIPAWFFWLKNKRRGLYGFPVTSTYIGAFFWIIEAFLLIVQSG